MKNIVVKILLVLSLFAFWNINFVSCVSATETEEDKPIKVTVTEKIPWADCSLVEWWEDWKWPYECNVQKWFWSVIKMMWNIIKYFSFLAWLWWVLFLVINWIMYSMGWIDPGMKDEAKKRIIWTIIWLIVLFLSWIILNMVAPWIYKG